MGDMEKIAAIAVVTALSAVVIRKQTPEIAMILGMLGMALMLKWSFSAVSSIREMLERLRQISGLSSAVVTPVLKTVGIAIMTQFAAEICRDAKEGGLAVFVEAAGAALTLALSLPLLEGVLSMIAELL